MPWDANLMVFEKHKFLAIFSSFWGHLCHEVTIEQVICLIIIIFLSNWGFLFCMLLIEFHQAIYVLTIAKLFNCIRV